METASQPRDNRKRWSGLQLQYGLPTPTTSPKLEHEQWTPIEHRVNALAEVQRLQERFAALARSENARILGTPPKSTQRAPTQEAVGVEGPSPKRLRSVASHRKSHSFDSGLSIGGNSLPPKSPGDYSYLLAQEEFDNSWNQEDDNQDELLDFTEDEGEIDQDSSILMVRARDLKQALRESKLKNDLRTKEPQSLSEATLILSLAFKAWLVAVLVCAARGERAIRLYIIAAFIFLLAVVLL
ncbi:hypothetical protein B9G98_04546 [Wickerhamiella sorbophila]|uniref:Uncharacterized protein n=1 Tax=Wickerhamiella sorbophila TaxID=45607 RepID=A0A2T0FPL5_9ASCO|nr:hypothetical protein B9G98_04546 [Wickerhamiella sorbophila]PRT56926.1 hypothetical protein B9G98_04546 [Wickerhamiella sorbophila]